MLFSNNCSRKIIIIIIFVQMLIFELIKYEKKHVLQNKTKQM